jgi:hypothetical protein
VPDFRVADTAPEHPKLRAAGIAAAGIWSMAGAHCMNPAHLTDGWVPEHWVHAWAGGRRAAAKLVEVRLWTRSARGGIPGYQFHDWLSIQRSAAQIEDEKAAARERAKRSRERSERAAQRTANVRRTDTAAHPVDNSDPDTESGASRVTPAGRRAPAYTRVRRPRHTLWITRLQKSHLRKRQTVQVQVHRTSHVSHTTPYPSPSPLVVQVGGKTSSSERVARQNDPPPRTSTRPTRAAPSTATSRRPNAARTAGPAVPSESSSSSSPARGATSRPVAARGATPTAGASTRRTGTAAR